jgi:hypothetical protein
MTEATWTNPGTSDDECQQAVKDHESQIPAEHRFGDDEQRRIIALDMAIRVRGDMPDDESIVKASRAFESYLKGD